MSQITQHTTSSGRTYQHDGKSYPSITTVLGATRDKSGLQSWRESVGEPVADYIMHNAAETGTETHAMIERYLNNHSPYEPLPSLMAHAHFENLKKYIKNIGTIDGIEKRMVSEEYGVAGTADCIADYKGILSVIDYKTKRRVQDESWLEDYFIQGAAYAEMYHELSGEMPENIVILVSSEDNMSQEVIRHVDDYIPKLEQRISMYKELAQSRCINNT